MAHGARGARHARHARHDWVAALCRKTTLSEYVLYGLYCDQVLGAGSGHWHNPAIHAYSHWSGVKLDEAALIKVRNELAPECAVVMINEKSNTPPELIRRVFVTDAPSDTLPTAKTASASSIP